MQILIKEYQNEILNAFTEEISKKIEDLGNTLQSAWISKKTVFFCGNGGSAGNAIHLANDFNYGIDKKLGIGMRVDALPANQSIITCIGNDEGYEFIYSQQLKVKASEGDVLIVLSGSGNSLNIINALKVGNELGMKTFAILGFSGGKCKKIAQVSIHFEVNDMQVSEDLQTMVGHMCMQYLYQNKLKEIHNGE